MFSVIYFFIYHAFLLKNLRQQKKEIKRLKSLVESEQEKHGSMKERNSELQQIVQRVQNRADGQPDLEPQALPEEETVKSSLWMRNYNHILFKIWKILWANLISWKTLAWISRIPE